MTGGTPDYTIVWMNADDNSTVDENSLVEGNYMVSLMMLVLRS